MTKIKEFFSKIFSAIVLFFKTIGKYIGLGFSKLFKTKAMVTVGHGLAYFPNKISDRLNNDQRKSLWGFIFIIPLLIGFVYFFLIPLILNVVYSLSFVEKIPNVSGLTTIYIGFNNYKYIFEEFVISINYESYTFPELILEALVEIVTDLPIILIFSLLMAVVLNSKFKGRTFVRAVFFMPIIFNSQAIDLASAAQSAMSSTIDNNTETIFEQMFSFKDFLLNANMPSFLVTFLSDASTKIYDIISYSGIQIIIFLSAIQSVPKHLYEAAKMEGATQYEMFWKITFPMVSPMLLTTAVYTIIDSYTRSSMIKAINKYTTEGSVDTTTVSGLTGKALETYNRLSGTTYETYEKLTYYGIGSALSLMYSVMVLLVIVIVLGILSKAVFYYDN